MTFVLSKPLAAELWAAAQLSPGETVADAIPRIGAVMARSAPATPTAEQGAVSNATIAELTVEPVGNQVKRYTTLKLDVYDLPAGRYDLVLRPAGAASGTEGRCPRCGELTDLLFTFTEEDQELGITHCGCFHEDDTPGAVPTHTAPDDVAQAVRLLGMMFDGYENGIQCNEDGDGAYLGQAFRLSDDDFVEIANLLNRCKPPRSRVSKSGLVVPDDAARDVEPMYYLQDSRSYVGNCPLWWATGGKGYTTRLDAAERYSVEKAMAQHKMRKSDVPWPCSQIDAILRPTVDIQDMGDVKKHVKALCDAIAASKKGGA